MPYGIVDKVICNRENHPEFIPQDHQTKVLNYFLNELKHKGLLLFHKLGSGKSCSSIMISDEMIKQSKSEKKKIFVMTPGSLRQNFIEEYCDRCGYKPDFLKKHYTFITTNYAVGKRLPDFNDSLVIIDEVHNLINGVKNQAVHPTLVYNKLMESNCKILALTGTPVFNYIWEWPFLGNLLKPGTFTNLFRFGELNTELFMDKFIIDSDGNVKPKHKNFEINLRGIISYFPGTGDGYYPKVIHEDPILIRMTPIQEQNYFEISTYENKIRNSGPPHISLLQQKPKEYHDKMEEYIMATKYIMSRYASNFYYPKIFSTNDARNRDEIRDLKKVPTYIYEPTGESYNTVQEIINEKYDYDKEEKEIKKAFITHQNKKDVVKGIIKKIKDNINKKIRADFKLVDIGWVEKSNFDKKQLIDVYSRKFTAIITNIISNWNAKHLVFSFYKTKAGVNMIHALFKMCNIKTEIYSGDISDSKRQNILKKFNSENNRYGQKIKALLVTEAGAEGINVLETQHIHIVESSTREMKIQQAIGRVVRFRSHMVEGRKPMPKNEQVVHIWRYWSIGSGNEIKIKKKFKNKDGKEEIKEEIVVDKTCVDEILYNKGRVFVNTIQSFLSLLKKSSVTPYIKANDKEGKLKDYKHIKMSPVLSKACDVSDARYFDNHHLQNDKNAVD